MAGANCDDGMVPCPTCNPEGSTVVAVEQVCGRCFFGHVWPEAAKRTLKVGMSKATTGLWRMNGVAGGKYLVQRRDGTVPDWPYFVIGARDPAAFAALMAYAAEAERLNEVAVSSGGEGGHTYDRAYTADIRRMAFEFDDYRKEHGAGDPDATPHRKDDPDVIAKMKGGA